MAMHVLENEYLKVMVADAGAELSSVFDKETEEERLWDANSSLTSLQYLHQFYSHLEGK